MHKYILLLFIGMSLTAAAQKISQKVFSRTWECTAITVPDSSILSKGIATKYRIMFYGPTSFERFVYFNTSGVNDTLVYSGYGNYSRRDSAYYFVANTLRRNTNHTVFKWRFENSLVLINDSTLLLGGNTYHTLSNSDPEKQVYYSYVDLNAHSFYVQNLQDSTLRVKVAEMNLELDILQLKTDPAIDNIQTYFTGSFEQLKGDSASLEIYQEQVYTRFIDNSTSDLTNYYPSLPKKITIGINSIQSIKYRPPFRRFMANTAGLLCFFSLLDLAASPFITGASNQNLRTGMVIGGLSGLGLAIPIAVIGKKKKFMISTPAQSKDKNYWQLRQEN